jgi:hypothetical protein
VKTAKIFVATGSRVCINTLRQAMAQQQANSAKSLQSLQSLERQSQWGESIRVKGKATKARVPVEVSSRLPLHVRPAHQGLLFKKQTLSKQEQLMIISTPKLTSVNLLTQAPSSTT